MARGIKAAETGQKRRNDRLLKGVKHLGKQMKSEVLPLTALLRAAQRASCPQNR